MQLYTSISIALHAFFGYLNCTAQSQVNSTRLLPTKRMNKRAKALIIRTIFNVAALSPHLTPVATVTLLLRETLHLQIKAQRTGHCPPSSVYHDSQLHLQIHIQVDIGFCGYKATYDQWQWSFKDDEKLLSHYYSLYGCVRIFRLSNNGYLRDKQNSR